MLFPFTFSPDQLLVGAIMGFLGRASCVLKSHRPADALSVLLALVVGCYSTSALSKADKQLPEKSLSKNPKFTKKALNTK